MTGAAVFETNGVTWDLTSYFDEFNGPTMRAFKKQLGTDVALLEERASKLPAVNADSAAAWEELVLLAENFSSRIGHISSYVSNLHSADATNESYGEELASLSLLSAGFDKFSVELQRALKDASDQDFALFLERPALEGAQHYLKRTRRLAQFTMSPPEEKLAADLSVDGIHAWGRLYDTVTSKLEFDLLYPDGRTERLPIAQWRGLMGDADREIGRRAFEGGNRAWQSIEDVCAAALNAIAGTRLSLYKYRGVPHFLDMALFQSSIESETLEAMYKAIHENIDTAREILRVKAKALGRPGIAWFEREAPLPLSDSSRYTWVEGSGMVEESFRRVYPPLADYYGSFIDKRWMESQVRPGKRPGAYCTGSSVTGEQRVYMTFNGSLNEVSTIAHEIGHAWHGHLLKDYRPLQQRYPMTLAETASIFAEQILAEGVYSNENIGASAKLQMLDADLCGAAVLLLDITARFEFERDFHELRRSGEVSVSRLKQLMVETQQRVMGDALLPGGEDPMFWASKLHFYITRVTFYNFPYTFGFLLSRALFGMFKERGNDFLPQYEDFLRMTGSDTVENVAQRSLGVDVSDPAFWAASIKSLEQPLADYRALLEQAL